MDGNKIESGPLSWQMDGVNTAVGLKYAGEDAELYRDILSDYRDSMEEQTEAIKSALAAEDLEAFTVEVHSLKSTSRTIGAIELSDRARELEEHGKRREWELILEKTPEFLSDYERLCSAIMPYCTQDEQKQKRGPLDKADLLALLSDLSESLEEYDSVRSGGILSALSEYDIADKFAVYMETLSLAISRFDYDTCKRTVYQWRKELDHYGESI